MRKPNRDSTGVVFKKVLAKYYHKWERDCRDSAVYVLEQNEPHAADLAEQYLAKADEYLNLILDNYDAIEFFRIGDRAFLIDSTLPEQFRGYE